MTDADGKPKPRNSLNATPSWDISEAMMQKAKEMNTSPPLKPVSHVEEELSPEEKAKREEYKVKKAKAIEEAWAQKARFAGKLKPGRKEALASGRRHDVRFDAQPKHVQEAILSSAAHENAFNPDSQVIQLALRTKRAMAEKGYQESEEHVVGYGSASKFNGGEYNKRPEFPTHSGDFVWASAEEVKEMRNDLDKPEKGKKAKKEKNEKERENWKEDWKERQERKEREETEEAKKAQTD